MRFKDYTRKEFLEKYGHNCPIKFNLPVFPICSEGEDEKECEMCLENSLKYVEFKPSINDFVEYNATAIDELRIVEWQVKMLSSLRDKLKGDLLSQMEIYGVDKFEDDNVDITYVKGCMGSKFNSSRFKKDFPGTYKEYSDPVIIGASISFKLK